MITNPKHSSNKPAQQASLHQLLDANASFAIDAKGTTNHCPMALIALAEMGADEARLQAFFAHWQEKYAIQESAPTVQLDASNWHTALAQPALFGALRDFFRLWLSTAEQGAVLQSVFTQIPFAPASGAFHALIRLAYGLQAQHQGEIAAGLAALCVGYFPLPMPQNSQLSAAVVIEQGLAELAAKVAGRTFTERWITSKLRQVAQDEGYRAALPHVQLCPDDVPQLALIAIAAYWQTRDFTILHMVTGLHALRVLLAHLPNELQPQLLTTLWPALAAAYVSVGAPALLPYQDAQAQAVTYLAGSANDISWPALLARAVASDNDHVIKMSYSCYAENLQAPSLLYQATIARMLAA